MLANTLLFVSLLCSLGVVRSQDCSDGYEYNGCGSQCRITCDNYEDPPVCLAVCAPGCYCPEGTVEHNGTCITTDECPPTTPSCSDGYEYNGCGSQCRITCDNYEDLPVCLAVCAPGCYCPEGTVEHNGTCITTDECPPTTPSCSDGYEYNGCGSQCRITCDNYEDLPVCLAVCAPGCYCPEGTVEHNGTCITTDECPPTTPSCSESYEYMECGSPCSKTCDNYEEDSICSAVCYAGCFCPEGTVEHNGMCITTDECPDVSDVCSGGKEWQECGTACPLTCDNYDDPPFACTLQCVQGCFCPDGKVDLNGVCVEPTSCSNVCSGGKEWQECGTACPLTCDNYDDPPFACTLQCVQGCFCPDGKVDLNGVCVEPTSCSNVCSGGKEWLECGTACPLTCDNYDNPPFACTLQCVQGCFCPAGKVDLNGVCVNSTTCKGCVYCNEGQTCTASHFEDYEYTECQDPIAVPCSGPYLPCPSNSRCVTHNVTGDSFCLESCYLDNGGCSDDQVCYYERRDDDECNQLLEPCFKTTCTTAHVTDSCPSGWALNPCGSVCQRTCEDYLTGNLRYCPEICGPPDCVCKDYGMVVFRDRCVDPLECYSLLTDEPDINPLPMPADSVLLQVTLLSDGILEDFDGAEFAMDVQQLIIEFGFDDVTVSLYATLGNDEDGNTVIILLFEGESIDGEKSAELLVEIVMANSGELSHKVGAVHSVDTPRAVYDEDDDDDGDDEVIVSVVVVVVVVISALLVVIVILNITICLVRKNRAVKRTAPDFEKPSYAELSTKEEMT